jgi:succinate dehydrogenase/fumarate reductase-like Fe-S protein
LRHRWSNPLVERQKMQWHRFCVDCFWFSSCDEATGRRLDDLHDPFNPDRSHTIMNCAKTCPKGLYPAIAIAEIEILMVERVV